MPARVWLAGFDEAETVAGLLVEFRDHMDRDWPSDNAFLAGVERLIEDPATEYLLGSADDDSPPQGVAQLRYRYGLWLAGMDCWLEDLYVRDEARGSGVGRALTQAAIDRAKERDCRRIELDVDERNDPARALYASLGFDKKSDFMRLRLDDSP